MTGFNTCKELYAGGPLSCQPSATCLVTCSDGEFCSSENTCISTGISLWKILLLRILFTKFQVTCISNSDCESISGNLICKETTPGGAKTCQPSYTCHLSCGSDQFCSSASVCQFGKNSIISLFTLQHAAFQLHVLHPLTVLMSLVLLLARSW